MVSSSSGLTSSFMLHVYNYIAEVRAFRATDLTVLALFLCSGKFLKGREYGSHLHPESAGRETEEAGLRPSQGCTLNPPSYISTSETHYPASACSAAKGSSFKGFPAIFLSLFYGCCSFRDRVSLAQAGPEHNPLKCVTTPSLLVMFNLSANPLSLPLPPHPCPCPLHRLSCICHCVKSGLLF